MRRFLLPLVVLPLFLTGSSPAAGAGAPTQAEFAASVDHAGRQRMLAQRAARDACQVILGIQVEPSKERLRKTMALFEQSLRNLRHGDPALGLPVPSAAAARQVEKQEAAWKVLRARLDELLAGRPDLTRIVAADRDVANEAQALVTLLRAECEAALGQIWGTIVDLAGKQRMLSQKMAKDVFLIQLDVHPKTKRAALRLSVESFDRVLKGLANGSAELGLPPTTDRRARAQLAIVQEVWKKFRPYMDRVVKEEALSPADLDAVATLSLRLLEESDKVVTIFGGLAGEG